MTVKELNVIYTIAPSPQKGDKRCRTANKLKLKKVGVEGKPIRCPRSHAIPSSSHLHPDAGTPWSWRKPTFSIFLLPDYLNTVQIFKGFCLQYVDIVLSSINFVLLKSFYFISQYILKQKVPYSESSESSTSLPSLSSHKWTINSTHAFTLLSGQFPFTSGNSNIQIPDPEV